MSQNPYEILGVGKDATTKDIQRAYRKLAKTLHPDLNPDDKVAEERFKAASSAYALLQDEDKRARYDRGEIDGTGAEKPQYRNYRDPARGAGGHYAGGDPFADMGDTDDMFSSFFSRRTRGGMAMNGRDSHFTMDIDLLEAVNGARKQISLPNGSSLDLQIPAGSRDGQVLRLRGKGEAGYGGGKPGDALIEIRVRPHPLFKTDGNDVRYEVPISLSEAVLGGKVRVPTLEGAVTVTLGPHSNTGKVLRLKGKGLPVKNGRGDAYVTLKIVLPAEPDAALRDFVMGWDAGKAEKPRAQMEAVA